MGAPKLKWTPEEEVALRAGVLKYGPGKWRTILKDPEFSGVLYLRSNVDLKDKWRNTTVMANGWGSREKAKLSLKRMIQAPMQDESSAAVTSEAESDAEIPEARPTTTSRGSPQHGGSRRSILRLDNLIMEAISNLNEPGGSYQATISTYIEFWETPNIRRLLSAKLKYLTATGKLIKMKRKYKVAPKLTFADRGRNLPLPLLDSSQRICSKVDQDDINMLTRSQIDLDLEKMRNMSPQEAAAAAAQAVAEADTATAEAAEAARKAEAAAAEAEAAQAFAEAAMKTLQERSIPRMLVNMVKKFVGME